MRLPGAQGPQQAGYQSWQLQDVDHNGCDSWQPPRRERMCCSPLDICSTNVYLAALEGDHVVVAFHLLF